MDITIRLATHNAAIEAARGRRAGTLWLGVWERNARAVAFYTKYGFVLGSDRQTDWLLARPAYCLPSDVRRSRHGPSQKRRLQLRHRNGFRGNSRSGDSHQRTCDRRSSAMLWHLMHNARNRRPRRSTVDITDRLPERCVFTPTEFVKRRHDAPRTGWLVIPHVPGWCAVRSR